MKELERNPLLFSANDDKLSISEEVETISAFYDTTVKKVPVENGGTHLHFKLPWSLDSRTLSNNYTQAKTLLLRSRKRLQSQPENMAKYCEKMQAINEGHLLQLPNNGAEGNSTEQSYPVNYILLFNTSQPSSGWCLMQHVILKVFNLISYWQQDQYSCNPCHPFYSDSGEKGRVYGLASDIANMFF